MDQIYKIDQSDYMESGSKILNNNGFLTGFSFKGEEYVNSMMNHRLMSLQYFCTILYVTLNSREGKVISGVVLSAL